MKRTNNIKNVIRRLFFVTILSAAFLSFRPAAQSAAPEIEKVPQVATPEKKAVPTTSNNVFYSVNAANGNGTRAKPYGSFATALSNVANGGTIQLLKSVQFNSSFNVTKNITVRKADGISDSVRILRKSDLNGALFYVKAGKTLKIGNIILDGNRTKSSNLEGGIVEVGEGGTVATFEMYDGAILRNGHRKSGGGAVYINSGTFRMYGGTLSTNYSRTLSAVVGVSGNGTNRMYLYDGTISGNDGARLFNMGSLHYYYVSPRIVYSSTNSNKYVPWRAAGTNIYNDSTKVQTYDVAATYNTEVKITVLTTDGSRVNPQPAELRHVKPRNSNYLIPKLKSDGKYYWDYDYASNFSDVKMPTATEEGIMGRKAHTGDNASGPIYSNTIYVDKHVLPNLADPNYNVAVNKETGRINYTITVDGRAFNLWYSMPASGYTYSTQQAPTLTSKGTALVTHPGHPQAEFDSIELPELNFEDYTYEIVGNDIVYTHVTATGDAIEINVAAPTDGYVWVLEQSPTTTEFGRYIKTHPTYPDYVFAEEIIPALSDALYSEVPNNVVVGQNNAEYTYVAPINGAVTTELPLEREGYVITMGDAPSATSAGSASLTHPDLPHISVPVTLPKLSDGDYTTTLDLVNNEVTYVWNDTQTGTSIPLKVSLPAGGYNLVANAGDTPSASAGGTVVVSHTDLPNVDIPLNVPAYNKDDFTIDLNNADDIVTLEYVLPLQMADPLEQSIVFTVPLVPNEETPAIIVNATTDKEGYALIYNNALEEYVQIDLPELDVPPYEFKGVVGGEFTYEYTDPAYPNLVIPVTYEMPLDSYDITLDSKPTATSTGSATLTHDDYPGASLNVNLPKLSSDDYDVNVANGEVTYTYDSIVPIPITVALPEDVDGDGIYTADITAKPTTTTPGAVVLEHGDLPGAEHVVTLPVLDEVNYTLIDTTATEAIYKYIDDVTKTVITVKVALEETGYVLSSTTPLVPPTNTVGGEGVAYVSHPHLPGVELPVELPVLSAENYEITHNATHALYTYYDEQYDVSITVEIALPTTGYDVVELDNPPLYNSEIGGDEIIVTHPDLPGLDLTLIIPMLDHEDNGVPVYDFIELTNKGVDVYAVYEYVDPSTNTALTFHIKLPEEGYDTPVVNDNPTHLAPGSVTITHPDYPGMSIEDTLPILSAEHYDIFVDVENNEVIYTYTNTETGEQVESMITLPATGFTNAEVTVEPTLTTTGTLTLEHPELPDVTLEITLPMLNEDDYNHVPIAYDFGAETITYSTLVHDVVVEVAVNFTLEDNYVVVSNPTTTSDGSALIVDGQLEIVLPALNADDYTYTGLEDGVALYTYTEPNSGLVMTLEIPLPEDGFVSGSVTDPTLTDPGSALLTHPDLPGFSLPIELPALNGDDYVFDDYVADDVIVDDVNVHYNYIDPVTGTIVNVKTPLPEDGYVISDYETLDANNETSVIITHPDLPGVEIAIDVPALNDIDADYTTEYVEGELVYFYEYTHMVQVDEEGVPSALFTLPLEITVPLPESDYDDAVVSDKPSVSDAGTATVTHPDLPGATLEIDLPKLNSDDYVVTLDEDEVVYTYIDPDTGVSVELRFDLPEDGYDAYTVIAEPTLNSDGSAFKTHSDYPGLEVPLVLPKLSDDNYGTPSVVDGEVVYEYINDEGETVTVKVDLPEQGFTSEVTSEPTLTDGGTATVSHPALPGLEITVTLPPLNDEDYEVTTELTGTEGTATYHYTDDVSGAQVDVALPFDITDFADLVWTITTAPTTRDEGVIRATTSNLPGATLETQIPALNEYDYDIVENADGTTTYRLKDSTYGPLSVDVAATEDPISMWPYIIIELVVILGLMIWVALRIKKLRDEKEAN